MKKILFGALVVLSPSCHPTCIKCYKNETASLYFIKDIDIRKSYAIIYAIRNDSVFKIISNTDNSECFEQNKIKINGCYKLDLIVSCPAESVLGIPIHPNLGIKGMVASDGEIIMLERKSHYKIYNALNLDGLCIK